VSGREQWSTPWIAGLWDIPHNHRGVSFQLALDRGDLWYTSYDHRGVDLQLALGCGSAFRNNRKVNILTDLEAYSG
jgi:hypothetical protein